MGKAVTTYDIDLRLAYMNQSIASLGNDLMLRRKAGMNCKESECKLALLNVYKEIISCYKDACSEIEYACFDEETLQKVLQTVGTLAGVCFPPTGLTKNASICVPEPTIVPITTTPTCINPIQALINSVNEGGNLERYLDLGMLLSKSTYCCPTCGIYSFSDVEGFLKLAEAIGLTGVGIPIYNCDNLTVKASVDTYLQLAEAIDLEPFTPIALSEIYMNKYINSLSEESAELVEDGGIVEFGKFTSSSSSKLILENFTEEQINNIILPKGISIICTSEYVLLGSIETILKVVPIQET